ncbi:Lrp/AsnC family transcriptional regulator [Priestia megaterium]|uniref:Lrp/AsnC family transcriptional regulator n=1 Tax=Priestia megaterium TaxID=1404 RepID=UPI00406BA178
MLNDSNTKNNEDLLSTELIDHVDLAILKALSQNARVSYQDIANELGISRVTVNDRVKKLVNKGVISGFHTHINFEALGYTVFAYVALIAGQGKKAAEIIIEGLKNIPEIEQIDSVAGRFDLIIKVRAKSHKHLQEILINKIGAVDYIDRKETMVILTSLKDIAEFDLSKLKF